MRKLLRILAWLVLAPIPLALLLAAGLWWWAGTDDSLATGINRAARYLPAGQTLEAQEVRGSLRAGGRIGMLRWRGNGLMVEAREVTLGWQPFALANNKLTLDTLQIAQLVIDDQRTPQPAKPFDSFVLPLEVDASFAVKDLQWRGPVPVQAADIAGRYRFDGMLHTLRMDSVGYAAGRYEADVTLLARAPMTLDARLKGELQAPLPAGGKALPVQATAQARGPLAGADALLEVQASVQPVTATAPASAGSATTGIRAGTPAIAASAMRATATASIMPWAVQPVMRGSATFASLDLALLWPQAPQTRLDGSVTLQPVPGAAQQWLAEGRITNSLGGPWDKGRLPVQVAQGRIGHVQGAWDIQSLTADIAGGQLQAEGRLQMGAGSSRATGTTGTVAASSVSGWQGKARLQAINPAALHTRFAAAALDGQLDAKAVGQAIEFNADLKPSARQPAASALQGLRIREGAARGRWSGGHLSLETLRLQTADALLQGQKVDVHIASRASSGQLQLSLPGAQAGVNGRISAADGAGEFSLRVADAALATRWLAQLPGMPTDLQRELQGTAAQGQGDASGRWQGGWQQQGRSMSVQAALAVPRLDVRSAGQSESDALRLRDAKLDINGRLDSLVLQLAGRLDTGTLRLRLQTVASAGRTAAGGWQGRLDTAALTLQDSFRPGTWTVQLRVPLPVTWEGGSSAQAATLQAGAGEATLAGPAAGTATIAWEPVSWRKSAGRTELRSRGQLRGLPLGWLELLGNTQLANLGLAGTMSFDGDWDLQAGEQFRLQAGLQRRSGDLRVQADAVGASATGVQINAGVKEASLRLTSDGASVRASLRWDSENAGQVTADIGTRVARGAEGWRWPADAPLDGTVRANLPRVGVWSVLAPPGWRMRGTLDANATLAGTRQAPHWTGTLQANDLALRSVVEGIEFSGGRLRATLSGLRLGIDEFSLQGAPGGGAGAAVNVAGNTAGSAASGGLLTVSGFVAWVPDGKPPAPAAGQAPAEASILHKVRMELSAKAQALRVSARADRRLTVSGALQARLVDTRVELRGNLRADQALIILPDETTPTLGSDVVIKSSVPREASASAAMPGSSGVRILPDVAIVLELGNDFRVQGRGVNTRLAGVLTLQTTLGATAGPRLAGEVRAVQGTYRAYGQYLAIEEGVLRFTGPFDNPAIDILAIRPNLAVRVGVQITGTALAPRVRLYASPDLPDAEKLAWLVLGRSAAAGGAESAVLQQAALALLGGKGGGMSGGLAQAIGLDEISFRGAATAGDGTTSSAAVTLGKRLSRDFYVAYERSVAGTMGTFYIFYDLSRRFTLRAQTGEQSAVDLIFTLPYD
ncbi:MAG: translocation/assembly module TamB domain-containing protein [Pseudomonadota bacterium]